MKSPAFVEPGNAPRTISCGDKPDNPRTYVIDGRCAKIICVLLPELCVFSSLCDRLFVFVLMLMFLSEHNDLGVQVNLARFTRTTLY
jgi:hypothetical protein